MTNAKVSWLPFYYGWVIAATGSLCIVACLGFGRFALGMLLPSMAATLKLSYAQMGFISTGNFIGYLVSVFFSGMIIARIGQRSFIFLSLLVAGLTMAMLSKSQAFAGLLALYVLTGMGTGGANVSMMSLASAWFAGRPRDSCPRAAASPLFLPAFSFRSSTARAARKAGALAGLRSALSWS